MQKVKIPGLITTLILTLVTSLMWIGLVIYQAIKNKPAPTVSQQVLQALDPTIDNDTANKMMNRVYFDEENISESLIVSPPTASPIPLAEETPSPKASASSLPIENQ